jgi:tetratricopeptide (TPR) repeat protein
MTLTPLRENGAPTSGSGCPDAELLAAYVDGRATLPECVEIEAHVARCEDCYFVFSETVQQQQALGNNASKQVDDVHWWRRWSPQFAAGLAAAAVLVVAAEVLIVRRSPVQSPDVDLRVALNQLDAAAGPYRKFEPRLSPIPTHHQLKPVTRSVGPTEEAPLALREAALRVERAAAAHGADVEAQRALAAMYLTLGRPGRAAEVLEPFAQSSDAGLLSDLAAAYLARNGEGDVTRAIELLERAVSTDPNRTEAWFNLGLAAETAGRPTRAIEAWQRALALDPASGWADEARARLKKLENPGRVP